MKWLRRFAVFLLGFAAGLWAMKFLDDPVIVYWEETAMFVFRICARQN